MGNFIEETGLIFHQWFLTVCWRRQSPFRLRYNKTNVTLRKRSKSSDRLFYVRCRKTIIHQKT